MSLLESFETNNTIAILSLVESKNEIGEIERSWNVGTENIPALLIINRLEYDKILDKKLGYIKSTHLCRIGLGNKVKMGDKVKDKDNSEFNVKFVYPMPGFGDIDHLLLYLDILI